MKIVAMHKIWRNSGYSQEMEFVYCKLVNRGCCFYRFISYKAITVFL